MDRVVNCFRKKPDAVARLICFPWAGGGSMHYARWGNVLNDSIEGNITITLFHIIYVWDCCTSYRLYSLAAETYGNGKNLNSPLAV